MPSEHGRPAIGDVATVSALSRIVRKRRRQLIALALLGMFLGTCAAVLDPGHTAASRVLLQGPRAKPDVLTEAELVTSQVVLDRAAQALDWGSSGLQLRSSVSAEPLSGNVLEIRCTGRNAAKAQQLTDQVAQQYLRFSTGLVSETLRVAEEGRQQRVTDLRERVSEAQTRLAQLNAAGSNGAEADLLQASIRSANAEISDIDSMGQASALEITLSRHSIKLIEPAVVMSGTIPVLAIGYVLGGTALFLLGGLLIHLVIASRDHRLFRPDDIAAALGVPVLSEVPGLTSRDGEGRFRRGRAQRRAYEKVHWDTPRICVDSASLSPRYRRLFARLRAVSDSGRMPMVIVFDDDAASSDAVTRLAIAAGHAGQAHLMCDDQDLRQRIEAAAQDAAGSRLTVQGSDQPISADCQYALRIARINSANPTVPDCTGSTHLVVAVGSGTRTPGELLALSNACEDAGRQDFNLIVVLPATGDSDTDDMARKVLSDVPADQPRVVESV